MRWDTVRERQRQYWCHGHGEGRRDDGASIPTIHPLGIHLTPNTKDLGQYDWILSLLILTTKPLMLYVLGKVP